MNLWAVTVDIFEPAGAGSHYPVVRHQFFGKTRAEATHYLESHLKTDVFLRDCMQSGGYKNILCYATVTVEKVR